MVKNFNTYNKNHDKKYGYDLFEKIFRIYNSMIIRDLDELEPETVNGKEYGLKKEYFDKLNQSQVLINDYNIMKYFCDAMREVDMDNHIILSGQNGTGKSITAITLAMYLYPDFTIENNMIFAYDSFATLIDKLSKLEDSIIVIDEANVFFHHKQHMDRTQIALLNAIEITRANRNIVISCVRDPRRINYAYRNGKVHTVIHFTDRSAKTGAPTGFVLQGMWFFEQEDKFMLHMLTDITDYDELDRKVENLSTLRGYMQGETLTTAHKKVIDEYKIYKKKQMLSAIDTWKNSAAGKKKGVEVKHTLRDYVEED